MSLPTENGSEDLQLLPDGKVLISSVSNVQSEFVDVYYSLFVEIINTYQLEIICGEKIPIKM